MEKKRIDVFICEQGLVKSRNVAQMLIKEDKVALNGNICRKSGVLVDENDKIEIVGELPKYVGRGGLKLEGAIKHFHLELNDKICLDIGASTGGFTDCMLQNGARLVYAVDVGTNQLDSKLLCDSRVVSLEKLDIRQAQNEIPNNVDFVSIDVSFISLKMILPEVKRFLGENGKCVALIKPQFEAGKKHLGKNGVIKDKKLQQKICDEIAEFTAFLGFSVKEIIPSPISGGDGNQEFLMLFCNKQ